MTKEWINIDCKVRGQSSKHSLKGRASTQALKRCGKDINNMTYDQVISIHGVPRSGTSWLGQIFNKHSNVAYRFQPLFSYRFKDRINLGSSTHEVRVFLNELYQTKDDDFIAGKWPPLVNDVFSESAYQKDAFPKAMVMKEVRYHHLIEKFIEAVPDIKVIGIIRNPCAVINSWLKSPKEFRPDWDVKNEWRFAFSKNQGRAEEFNGYEKWKKLTLTFLEFEQKCPQNFFLVQYEQLAVQPVPTVEQLFSFCKLNMEQQVIDFIVASQSIHLGDAYAVFKSPDVKDRWKTELDPNISSEIIADLKGTKLEKFLR